MIIKSIAVGPLQANCIIAADDVSHKALVVDPGDESDRIVGIINEMGLTVEIIVCTHGHFDHMGVVGDIKNLTGARVALHRDELPLYNGAKDMAAFWGHSLDAPPGPDILLSEGDTLTIGALNFSVLHTPGHSPGGICLYADKAVITGDTLFKGSVGRTDFYGGDMEKLRQSFRRLMALPEDTNVWPGHGPATTIGREKKENMFAEEFLL
ncbi:MAG TPA: MBL fold metallo-hydrolase [Dissulfurispiraceae bacterium]|nr:MBL fold metallo-hydrolase [Dissulfurispiraceae bacterium]